jgi:hypothetical protein
MPLKCHKPSKKINRLERHYVPWLFRLLASKHSFQTFQRPDFTREIRAHTPLASAESVAKLSWGRVDAMHFPPNRLRISSAGSLKSNVWRSRGFGWYYPSYP